jgi:Mn2+/Fe2+ NRAMP family transporter
LARSPRCSGSWGEQKAYKAAALDEKGQFHPIGDEVTKALECVKAGLKVFLVACVFYICYIISGIIVKPDWGNVFQHFVNPQLSLSPSEMTMVIGLVGTTIAPWMQFYLQASIVEKGIKIEEYKFARFDVVLGSVAVVATIEIELVPV